MPRPTATSVIAVAICALSALLIADFIREQRQNKVLSEAYRQHFSDYMAASRMRQSTDDLTRLARTYAVTGDARFLDQYGELLRKRDGKSPEPEHYDWVYWDFLAVEGEQPPTIPTTPISYDDFLLKRDLTTTERQLLIEARQKSDDLTAVEKSVFVHVQNGGANAPDYLKPLFDRAYHQQKLEILSRVNQAFGSIEERARQRVMLAQRAIDRSHAVQVSLFVGLLLSIAAWTLLKLRSYRHIISVYDKRAELNQDTIKKAYDRLDHALEEIRTLEGLLPICAYCHSIRDECGHWHTLERYMADRRTINFTHGICPQCRSDGAATTKAPQARLNEGSI